ncbi:MAG: methyl-accepting chemotaxis protein [Pseudomonadota bacterium]
MIISAFKSMSIARRMTLGFASVLVLLVAVAGFGSYALRLVSNQMNQIVKVNNVKTKLANSMLDHISSIAIQARTVSMLSEVDAARATAQANTSKASFGRFLQAESELAALLKEHGGTQDEIRLLKEIADQGKLTWPEVEASVQQGLDGDNVASGMSLMNRVAPPEAVWRDKVAQLIALQGKLIDEASASAVSAERRSFIVQGALVSCAVALGLLIAWAITRSVVRPIGFAVVVAERIAEGDLTTQVVVSDTDETGRLLHAVSIMQDRLRDLVGEIRDAAYSIEVAGSDVAAGNADLSGRTEQTTSSLQQTASSMEELTSTVRHSAEAASQANALASTAAEVAARGGIVVSQVVSTMNEINASSKKIAEITSVIDSIAFQTNILALNAAVEAARAGEQGRGFAVVAGEVRNLAQRSAEAAKEIKSLIGRSVDKVETGSRLVADAGRTMSEIVGSVQRVSDIINDITVASSEQSDGITQVNSAVVHLDAMTQQNAALVEQGAAAAESLKAQASRLSEVVGTFRLERDTGDSYETRRQHPESHDSAFGATQDDAHPA